AQPKTAEAGKALVLQSEREVMKIIPPLRERFAVKSEPTVIAGVKAFILTPENIPETNKNRVLVHVHGGGYVFNPGESGTGEGIMIAGTAQMKVIPIHYRM